MNTNRISVRYAKALFELAAEEKKADKVNNDMHLLLGVSKEAEFKGFLDNPVIFPSKKQEIFNLIFKDKIDQLSLNFFKLLTDKKREIYLDDIARNYNDFYRKYFGIKSVEMVTPFVADKKLNTEISNIIAAEFKTKVELTNKTNPDIVGGFILTVEGMQFDASVSTKLKDIKKELLDANG